MSQEQCRLPESQLSFQRFLPFSTGSGSSEGPPRPPPPAPTNTNLPSLHRAGPDNCLAPGGQFVVCLDLNRTFKCSRRLIYIVLSKLTSAVYIKHAGERSLPDVFTKQAPRKISSWMDGSNPDTCCRICSSSGKQGTEVEAFGHWKDVIVWTFFFFFPFMENDKTLSWEHRRQRYFIRRDWRILEGERNRGL